MSTRDRRSQRIRDQIRAHANPRSGRSLLLPHSFQEQLKRVYAVEGAPVLQSDTVPVADELARLVRRRR